MFRPVRPWLCLCAFLWLVSLNLCGPPAASSAEQKAVLKQSADPKGRTVALLKNREYFHALSGGIREARKEIILAFFMFKATGRPKAYPDMLLQALGDAARRGVRVVLVLEQDEKPDSAVHRDNRNVARRLEPAGVEIRFDSPSRTMHTKLAVIDGRYTFIGSHNLTQSALKHNSELSVLIDSPILAEQALQYIRGLY